MNDLLHNEDLLIRYLDGELGGHEKASLEERLRTDKSLQEELTKLRVAIQAVKHLGTTQQVSSIHAQMMQELKPQEKKAKVVPFKKAVRYTMAVAAGILVLFIGVRLYMSAQPSPEKLYSESFVDFNASATRGNDENKLSLIEKSYLQKDYAAIMNTSRSNNLDAKDSLLIGLSYLHTDRISQAIGFFQRIAFSDNEYKPDGEFYLSLGYLKNKNYDKALALMQKIADNPAHLYHEQFTDDLIEKVKDLERK